MENATGPRGITICKLCTHGGREGKQQHSGSREWKKGRGGKGSEAQEEQKKEQKQQQRTNAGKKCSTQVLRRPPRPHAWLTHAENAGLLARTRAPMRLRSPGQPSQAHFKSLWKLNACAPDISRPRCCIPARGSGHGLDHLFHCVQIVLNFLEELEDFGLRINLRRFLLRFVNIRRFVNSLIHPVNKYGDNHVEQYEL